MTLATAANRNNYVGNGTTPTYAYGFRIFATTDLRVVVVIDGVKTVLTLNTHYTVAGAGAANGTISLVAGAFDWLDGSNNLDDDVVLSIRRVRPLTQTTNIRNQGDYFPARHEDAFDHFVMLHQQQQDELDRCLKLDESIDPDDFDMTLPAIVAADAGKAIGVNATYDGLELIDVGAASFDVTRIFNADSYANLKAAAAAAPTLARFGFANDTGVKSLVFYCADTNVGDGGWIIVAGAGGLPTGGPI